LTKKELYKASKDIGFREYAIGMAENMARYMEYQVHYQQIIRQGTVVQLVHVELGLLVSKYFIFVPKFNITLLIKHGVDDFDVYFEKYIPNYNKLWDSVNEY
jgi:5-formaminoimidazole-4-carboxamide-1-beta-D-ribofuranosyl 5'-monophosphate synthetase